MNSVRWRLDRSHFGSRAARSTALGRSFSVQAVSSFDLSYVAAFAWCWCVGTDIIECQYTRQDPNAVYDALGNPYVAEYDIGYYNSRELPNGIVCINNAIGTQAGKGRNRVLACASSCGATLHRQ